MSELFISNAHVQQRLAERPASYAADLEACVVRRDAAGIYVDPASPAWAALVAKYRRPARGLGDTVKRVLDATGVSRVVKYATKGRDCGCEKRRQQLNAAVPYN